MTEKGFKFVKKFVLCQSLQERPGIVSPGTSAENYQNYSQSLVTSVDGKVGIEWEQQEDDKYIVQKNVGQSSKRVVTFNNWMEALGVYASVYNEEYPEEAASLSCYLEYIRMLMEEKGNFLEYDRWHRQVKENHWKKGKLLPWDYIWDTIYTGCKLFGFSQTVEDLKESVEDMKEENLELKESLKKKHKTWEVVYAGLIRREIAGMELIVPKGSMSVACVIGLS